jgi:integrase
MMKVRLPKRRPSSLSICDTVAFFDGELERGGRASRTRKKYVQNLMPFVDEFADRPPASVTTAELDSHFAGWADEFEKRYGRRPAPATTHGRLTAVVAFYDYLSRTGRLIDADGREVPNPARRLGMPKRPQNRIDYLTPEEDDALLACRGTPQEEIVVWLLRFTGVRAGEARELRIRDFDFTPGRETLRVTVSKTQAGIRQIPLLPEFAAKAKEWIEYLRAQGLYSPNAPFLSTRNGTPMHATYIDRVVKRVAHRAGVRARQCTCGSSTICAHAPTCRWTRNGEHRADVSPHTLRRTFGTANRNRGIGIEHISNLLGHSSTTVTERAYAELLPDTTRAAFLAGHGIRRVA